MTVLFYTGETCQPTLQTPARFGRRPLLFSHGVAQMRHSKERGCVINNLLMAKWSAVESHLTIPTKSPGASPPGLSPLRWPNGTLRPLHAFRSLDFGELTPERPSPNLPLQRLALLRGAFPLLWLPRLVNFFTLPNCASLSTPCASKAGTRMDVPVGSARWRGGPFHLLPEQLPR